MERKKEVLGNDKKQKLIALIFTIIFMIWCLFIIVITGCFLDSETATINTLPEEKIQSYTNIAKCVYYEGLQKANQYDENYNIRIYASNKIRVTQKNTINNAGVSVDFFEEEPKITIIEAKWIVILKPIIAIIVDLVLIIIFFAKGLSFAKKLAYRKN